MLLLLLLPPRDDTRREANRSGADDESDAGNESQPLRDERRGPHRASGVGAMGTSLFFVDAWFDDDASERRRRPTEWLFCRWLLVFFLEKGERKERKKEPREIKKIIIKLK